MRYISPSILFLFRVNTAHKFNVFRVVFESSGSYNDNYTFNNSELSVVITAGHQGQRWSKQNRKGSNILSFTNQESWNNDSRQSSGQLKWGIVVNILISFVFMISSLMLTFFFLSCWILIGFIYRLAFYASKCHCSVSQLYKPVSGLKKLNLSFWSNCKFRLKQCCEK